MQTSVQSPSISGLLLVLTGLFLLTGTWNDMMAQRILDRRVQVENREALALLEKADNDLQKGRYSEAATRFLKLLTSYSYAAVGKTNRRYVGVQKIVRERLSEMESDGRQEVRTLFRKEGARRFERAKSSGDISTIRSVARVYWMTNPGRRAMLRLARRAYKRGRLKTTIHWWTEHLKSTPNQESSQQTRVRIQHVLDQLPDDLIFYELRNYGKRSSKDQRQQQGRNLAGRASSASQGGDWPRPGGNNTGTGRVESVLESYGVGASARELIGLWTDSAVSSEQEGAPGSGFAAASRRTSGSAKTRPIDQALRTGSDYSFSPLQPIVYRGTILVNDGSNLFAFALQDQVVDSWNDRRSRLLWTYPDVQRSLDQQQVRSLYSGKQGYRIRSLTGYNGAVYAHLRGRLHKVDPNSGRSAFVSLPPKLDGAYLSFNGTPVVTEHGIFVPLLRRTVGNRGQLYIAKYGHDQGNLEWYRFIGVTNIGDARNQWMDSDEEDTRKLMHLLSQGNQVLASTNMGVVASLNAVTGQLSWVYDYSGMYKEHQKEESEPETWSPSTGRRGMRPPRIIGDTLYVLPSDSRYFLGFDLHTGKKILQHAVPDVTGFLDHGFLDLFNGAPTAILSKDSTSGTQLTVLRLTPGDSEEENIDMSFSARPSSSPGVHRLFLGGDQQLRSMRRENMFMKYDAPWPAQNKLGPHELIATGDHIILVGPGGIAVLTTGGALFRNLAGKSLRSGFPAHLFPF